MTAIEPTSWPAGTSTVLIASVSALAGIVAGWLAARVRAGADPARLLDSAPEGFMVFDRAGRCVRANVRGSRAPGGPDASLVGRSVEEVFDGRLPRPAISQVRHALASGAVMRLADADGAPSRAGELLVVPVGTHSVVWLREAEGPGAGSESERELAALRAENTERLLSESRKRHDLMQPLGSIVNYAELIRELADGDQRTYALNIARLAGRMAEQLRGTTAPTSAAGPSAPAPGTETQAGDERSL